MTKKCVFCGSPITRRGIRVPSVICDGRRGVLKAAKELRDISLRLKDSTGAKFTTMLDEWHSKCKKVLDEKSANPETRKTAYTHKRLRSAYRSLRDNMSNLFEFEHHKELDIPIRRTASTDSSPT